jgi:hypothetical protein
MTVCPFSPAGTTSHNLARWGVAHSPVFRRVVYQIDTLFYGRDPKRKKARNPFGRWAC